MDAPHDSGYKLLFSHPRMVEDLLRGFVPEDWVQQLDFSTLEKVNGHYVGDDLRQRADDVVWRLRWGDDWIYVYLLIEFQSRPDRWMAVRMLAYVALLYQDLVRQRAFTASGRLPPVLPLVLYNGDTRWQAATRLGELIEAVPGGLERYRPELGYLLLDEGALDEAPQLQLRNLAAALFALEKSISPEQLRQTVAALADWLQASEQTGLRRSFTIWIKRVLLPGRMPGTRVPELNDLQEVKAMLAERVKDWTRDWKRQGIEEGRVEGRAEGRVEGERQLLKRQLFRRFGPISAEIGTRVDQADTDTLERWAEDILDATRLEDLFGG